MKPLDPEIIQKFDELVALVGRKYDELVQQDELITSLLGNEVGESVIVTIMGNCISERIPHLNACELLVIACRTIQQLKQPKE